MTATVAVAAAIAALVTLIAPAPDVCERVTAPILDVRGRRGPATLDARRSRCRAYVVAGMGEGVPAHVTAALGWAETRWGVDDDETGRSGCCHGPLQVSMRVHARGSRDVRAVAVRTLGRLWREERGDVVAVAARWNAGPAWRRSPRAQRWARYVARVAEDAKMFTDDLWLEWYERRRWLPWRPRPRLVNPPAAEPGQEAREDVACAAMRLAWAQAARARSRWRVNTGEDLDLSALKLAWSLSSGVSMRVAYLAWRTAVHDRAGAERAAYRVVTRALRRRGMRGADGRRFRGCARECVRLSFAALDAARAAWDPSYHLDVARVAEDISAHLAADGEEEITRRQ